MVQECFEEWMLVHPSPRVFNKTGGGEFVPLVVALGLGEIASEVNPF